MFDPEDEIDYFDMMQESVLWPSLDCESYDCEDQSFWVHEPEDDDDDE